jgi:hypothetical protein
MDGHQRHLTGGDGAGLVQDDGVGPPGGLQDFRALDEDAELGAASGADEQRGGRGESQGAGAGDDEDGDRGGEGLCRGGAGEQPPGECGERQGDHDRHEDRGHAVGEPLDGRLAGLGGGHQAGDLGECGVRADPGGADHEASAGVDGRADHGIARADFYGDGLAGEHAGVDGGGAFDDDAVGSDLLPGANDEEVADGELVRGDADLAAAAQDGDVLGAEFEQGAEGCAGAALGAGLEVAAEQDEDGDAGGDFEVELGSARAVGPRAHASVGFTGAAEEQRPQGPAEGGEDADGDQGVHGGGPMSRVDRGGTVERPGTPDGHRRGQGEGQPLPVAELQGRDHRQQDHRH